MKKFVLLICAIIGSLRNASTQNIVLRVSLNDGTQNEFVIAERPIITFENDNIVFLYRKLSTSYPKKRIVDFVFEDTTVGIKDLKIGDTRVFYFDNNDIIIEGIDNHDQIKVFSINGIQQNAIINQTNNRAFLSLSGLSKGHYIINIGNKQSVKITKR